MSMRIHPKNVHENSPQKGPRRGGGVKKWQNYVHVVVECPHTIKDIAIGEDLDVHVGQINLVILKIKEDG